MTYLLDTHTLIWFLEGNPSLKPNLLSKIQDVDNRIVVSVASLWEIAIKHSLGKLVLEFSFQNIPELLREAEIEILPINFGQLKTLLDLPFFHRDPFDRLLASASIFEQIDLIGKDEIMDAYLENQSVKRIW